ncbi:SDR family oxidoreductase [Paraburkholderia sp. EG285A]|uniref:SDR family oxidoreductase n=1 Tax=Paraburkholderia sp. EG285A TaxID=3237009 RepID=UPI0034D2AA8B
MQIPLTEQGKLQGQAVLGRPFILLHPTLLAQLRQHSMGGAFLQLESQSIYDDIAITQQREAIVPLKRIGSPNDVARTVDFLIDRDNRYITGENIMVDGGLTLSVLDRIPGIARRKKDLPMFPL